MPGTPDQQPVEPLTLRESTAHLLEECRMILPGVQAIFGFQLIAVFSDGFTRHLALWQQELHLVSILLISTAAAMLMTPAIYHRGLDPRKVTARFLWISSRLMLGSLVPMALGLCLDFFLIAEVVLQSVWLAALGGLGLGLILLTFWVIVPLWIHRRKIPSRFFKALD